MPAPSAVYPRGLRKKSAGFAAASLTVLAQVPSSRYEGLNHALGLTDSQVWQLQHRSHAAGILNDSQLAKLTAIERVLDRSAMASLAICYYPIRVYASELDLTDSQVERFRAAAADCGY